MILVSGQECILGQLWLSWTSGLQIIDGLAVQILAATVHMLKWGTLKVLETHHYKCCPFTILSDHHQGAATVTAWCREAF